MELYHGIWGNFGYPRYFGLCLPPEIYRRRSYCRSGKRVRNKTGKYLTSFLYDLAGMEEGLNL